MLNASLNFYKKLKSDNKATINYIYSIATSYKSINNLSSSKELDTYIVDELNKHNWKSVEVEYIERMSFNDKDDIEESYVNNEFKLINIKDEKIDEKFARFQRLVKKIEGDGQKHLHTFTMKCKLVEVYVKTLN
jgi:hypothetical protein